MTRFSTTLMYSLTAFAAMVIASQFGRACDDAVSGQSDPTPGSYNGIHPDIYLRQREVDGDRDFAMIVSLRVLGGRCQLFNPFAIADYGVPYEVVVYDEAMHCVATIMASSELPPSVETRATVTVDREGVVGICLWLIDSGEHVPAFREGKHELFQLTHRKPGRYFVKAFVRSSMFHGNHDPSLENTRSKPSGTKESPFLCASGLQEIVVAPSGRLSFPQSVEPFHRVVVERLDRKQILVQMVNDETRSFHDPFVLTAFRDIEPVHLLRRDIGAPGFQRQAKYGLGKFLWPDYSRCVTVPANGVVGGTMLVTERLESERTKASECMILVNEAITRDYLYDRRTKLPVQSDNSPGELFRSGVFR